MANSPRFNFDGKSLAILALLAVVVYIVFFRPQGSPFTLELVGAPLDDTMAVGNAVDTATSAPKQMKTTGNGYEGGGAGGVVPTNDPISLSSAALLPKEIPITDDFGQFSSEQILSGQNYLDPRGQIGYPETVGGTLRNSNLQIRSEPSNPRDPVSIWNLSTISPDDMRPLFEIQDKEYA
jgi:hypothetical protein